MEQRSQLNKIKNKTKKPTKIYIYVYIYTPLHFTSFQKKKKQPNKILSPLEGPGGGGGSGHPDPSGVKCSLN